MRKMLPPILLSAACATTPAPAPAPAPPPAPAPAPLAEPPAAPTLRLSEDVKPVHYDLDVTLVPGDESARGSVKIDVELARPATGLWLHAAEITVAEASVTAGGETLPATVIPQPAGDTTHLGLRFPRELPAGPAQLRIIYQARQNDRETHGIFRQKDSGRWYAFTHMETTDASRAFPCFDDPRWKTPWHVTLHVKAEHAAFSNTPVEKEAPEEGGMKAVTFKETRPLPSYLVAFAAGPFVAVDAGKSKGGAPARILAFQGREREAAYAAQVTVPVLNVLEDYFGMPFPFEKIDSIAVPQTVGFSAMENPGLVTYNDDVILARPEADTLRRRRRYAGIAAHELAHMWFGDLVTLAWWDDTWLNESFASWMASKAVEKLEPTWGEGVERIQDRSRALGMDTLESTRAVRQPIKGEGDIENAFDRITYAKGQAVLEMFEAWLGPEVFRKGVQAYLRAHAYGNATATDFFAAVGEAAGHDVSPVLSTFIDQPGAPLVTASLECVKGAKPAVKLAQERYVLPGAPASDRRWKIPVCVRSPGGRSCTVLEEQGGAVELPDASCPAWIYPNAGGSGYYRSAFAADLGPRVLKAAPRALSLGEQVALLGDLGALQRAGKMPAGDVLATLPTFALATNRHLAAQAVQLLDTMRGNLVTADLAPRFAVYVNRLFGARARALGFLPRPRDSEDDEILRSEIVPLVAIAGRDPKLAAEARRLALKWLDDRKSLPADVVSTVLATAAATNPPGDRVLLDRLMELARTSPEPAERNSALRTLGAFEEPALLSQALMVLLDDKVDVREAGGLMIDIYRSDVAAIRTAAYHFQREHYDQLMARMPRASARFSLRLGSLVCDEEGLADYQKFFADKAQATPGGDRIYAQVVDNVKACIAMRQAQRPSTAAYLRRN